MRTSQSDLLERAFMKLGALDRLDPDERAGLQGAFRPPRRIARGEEIAAQGPSPPVSTAILDGFAARVTTLEDGGEQISEIIVPGDFADLHSFLLRHMDHSVVALSACVVSTVAHRDLRRLTDRFRHLTRVLWASTLADAAIHRQWIVGMGRRDALGQLAHLLCELLVRLSVVGLVDGDYALPLHQARIGDVLGRSRSNVNATLQELQSRGLLTWTRQRVRVLDWEGLVRLADFDERYLQLKPVAL
jgi:CRP-like cAMP-binding protein